MAIDYTKRPKSAPVAPPAAPPAQPYQPPAQPYQQQPAQSYQQPPAQQYQKQPYQQQPAAQPYTPPVSLQKVTLSKSAPSVSLTKQGSTTGHVRVNLNWAQSKGTLFRRSSGIDLDLACLWEFTDGRKGIVQALGNSFQAPRQGQPIIYLDGDDRTGSATGGENMYIDLSQSHLIRRILIFAYIYEGAPNWASANGVVTLFPQSGPQIEVFLDEATNGAISCAIALLENRNGELVINREVRYIRGAQDIVDQAYGWGLDWKDGRK